MNNKHNRNRVCFLILIFMLLGSRGAWANRTPYDWALVQLDYIRQEKVDQLERFMARLHSLAREAATDQTITSFFEMNRQYYHVQKFKAAPASLANDVENMRQHFNGYYIANYFAFYDILFVDIDGSVFHTLRKETDHDLNLINSRQSIGMLSEAIAKKPDHEVFVDFYEYGPSSEPAAFFIEPVLKEGVKVGWVILQCPINKLNSIFSATDDMGKTGETFLVNSQGLMLTESYFKGKSTILREHLDDRNIKAKFRETQGHRLVNDYRGAVALSSFKVFTFLDTRWLVVAKIDKAEIITNHYKTHKTYYGDCLIKYLKKTPLKPSDKPSPITYTSALRVDMDEFLKARNHEILETWGVSTCTGLIAAFPKKFGYLAHISPKDRIYNKNETNLLSAITKKIKSFDIYPCERRDVLFLVVAAHFDSLTNAVNQLVDDGFLLSQIRVALNSSARSAAIVYDYDSNRLNITWTMNQKQDHPVAHGLDDLLNAGEIIEKIMADESNPSSQTNSLAGE
ncbi:MAG: cache domain-containing protein [Pseudomonadota bacterium]